MKKVYVFGCCLIVSTILVSGCNLKESAPGPIKDSGEETQELIASF